MAILVVTLMTLQWQLDSLSISASEYGSGILLFSLVLFSAFFITLSVLKKLLGRSIVGPVENILPVVSKIKEGNFQTRMKVVSNDEIGGLGDAINEMTKGLIERERNASSDATQIIDAIFGILHKFIGDVKIEDDLTSVIIKMQD
jgi:methyl-accepting chemotaxis protein